MAISYNFKLSMFDSIDMHIKMVLALKPLLENGISQNIVSSMGTGDAAGVFHIADLGWPLMDPFTHTCSFSYHHYTRRY